MDGADSDERIQKLGDFQFTAAQHRLAVAEQQNLKVVIEQFAQRSFKLRGIIEFGLRNQAQRMWLTPSARARAELSQPRFHPIRLARPLNREKPYQP